MLPHNSRFVLAIAPAAEWSWDKETQSRILAKLDCIAVLLQNAFRDKKKSSPAKPEEQWQPKFVKEAKEELQRKKHEYSEEEMEALKAYWKARNRNAKFIGENDE